MRRKARGLAVAACLAAMAGAGQACAVELPEKVKPLPPPAAEVRIAYAFDDPARAGNFLAVAREIVAAFETKVAPEPALGRRPLVVVPSTDGMPRANVGEAQYNVIVTCLGSPWFTQFAYQLGHELGHFWIGPDSTSWFKESTCTALSFAGIGELARQWKDCPSAPAFAEAADNMRDYHDRRTIQPHLDKLGLKDVDAAMKWARQKGPELLKAGAGQYRDEEQVMSKVIERVLSRHPGQWGALQALAEVDGPRDAAGFEQWRGLVKTEQQPLVADLAAALGVPIERGRTLSGDSEKAGMMKKQRARFERDRRSVRWVWAYRRKHEGVTMARQWSATAHA